LYSLILLEAFVFDLPIRRNVNFLFKEIRMATSKFISRLAFLALTASVGASAMAAPSVKDGMYGSPAPVNSAQRTITLNKNYANVAQGETVKFVTAQGESFAWNFDTWTTNTFKLSTIAPANVNVGSVQVYVESNPLYRGSN
jgi:hypothetical protein